MAVQISIKQVSFGDHSHKGPALSSKSHCFFPAELKHIIFENAKIEINQGQVQGLYYLRPHNQKNTWVLTRHGTLNNSFNII